METTNNEYDIFFSHPSEDQEKATLIVKFLKQIISEALNNKYSIFYSPKALTKDIESTAWRNGINNALKDCKCMIIYYTPNALKSKWMNYEIGAMASRSKPLIPITTGAVDMSKVIINDDTAVNIATDNETLENCVIRLIEKLNQQAKISNENQQETSLYNEEQDKKAIMNWFSDKNNSTLISNFIKNIRTQTIYIIGSKPTKASSEWNNSLVVELSNGLLKKEFNLASSPSVKEVGYIVARECLATPTRYTIAGLHRFESNLIKTSILHNGDIKESITMFRKRYLSNIDAIIVIGGKRNTLSEIEVATKEKKQIFYIPCMGGVGAKFFDDKVSKKEIPEKYPCYNCNACLSCPKIEELCDYIANNLHELTKQQ